MAHPQNNVFRKLAIPGLIGSLLFCHEFAHAQQVDPLLAPNDQVIQAWQQGNAGAPAPSLKREEDGSTRIEWKGGITLDTYANDVWSANGNINTPLRTGSFFRSSINSDLRAVHADNTVDYFQIGITQSNDLSVLSQNRYQLNNIQLGHSGEGYLVALGDVAPNFSSLSSALGVRGLYGQRQFRDITAYGFTGLVAESWEALDNRIVRNTYLKDVHGIKLEKAFGPSLKTYVTSQSSSDREPSGNLASNFLPPRGKSSSVSGGFQYQQGSFSLGGETADSGFDDGGTSSRSGRASIVDGSWHGDSVGLRAGYHDINSGYTSLSLAAQAGVREAYTGADWTVASWLTLTTDLRRSKSTTLAAAGIPSTFVDTDSGSARANINFGPDHPGWALSFQQAGAHAVNSVGQASRNRDMSSTLNYSTPAWNAGVGFGRGKVVSEVFPGSDSLNDNWSFTLGRTFSDALPERPQTWSVSVNFAAAAQTQKLLAGGQTSNTSYTLTLAGQRTGWGSVNLLLTGGETTQPLGGPNLRLQGVQLEAVYPLKGQSSLKAYVRNTRRNIDDALLASRENVAGIQLVYSF